MTEQAVVPMLAYADGRAAMDWLISAFGFTERARVVDASGRLTHGELTTPGGGHVMLATPSTHYEGPARHREHCEAARRWSEVPWVVDGVLVYVPDVRAHLERALAAGAILLGDMETSAPAPRYRVEDVEGHRWMFMERRPSQATPP